MDVWLMPMGLGACCPPWMRELPPVAICGWLTSHPLLAGCNGTMLLQDPLKAEWEGKKKKKGDKKGAGGKGGGAKKTATSGANKKGEGGKGGKKGAGDAAEGAAPPKKKRKDLTVGWWCCVGEREREVPACSEQWPVRHLL